MSVTNWEATVHGSTAGEINDAAALAAKKFFDGLLFASGHLSIDVESRTGIDPSTATPPTVAYVGRATLSHDGITFVMANRDDLV